MFEMRKGRKHAGASEYSYRMKILLATSLLFMFSCASKRIPYSQYKISAYEKRGYKVWYNDELVSFRYLYPDKRNVSKVNRDKKHRIISVYSKTAIPDFKDLDQVLNEIRTVTGRKFTLLCFDGKPWDVDSLKYVKIEDTLQLGYQLLTGKQMTEIVNEKVFEEDFIVLFEKRR